MDARIDWHDRDAVAFTQNGRDVPWRDVTTEDLLVSAVHYQRRAAQQELAARGIDWCEYR